MGFSEWGNGWRWSWGLVCESVSVSHPPAARPPSLSPPTPNISPLSSNGAVKSSTFGRHGVRNKFSDFGGCSMPSRCNRFCTPSRYRTHSRISVLSGCSMLSRRNRFRTFSTYSTNSSSRYSVDAAAGATNIEKAQRGQYTQQQMH